MSSITVNISGKCNAKCRHCCFSCSPTNKNSLCEKEIWDIVNYGISKNDISEISISGGEPFLYEDFIYEIVKDIAKNDKISTCITNGFWATNYDKAYSKLKKFNEAGLKYLTVSFDDFHNEFISINNIRNILLASYQLNMKISINMAVTQSMDGIKLLNELKDYLLGVPVTRFSVMPVGAGHKIECTEMYYHIDLEKPLRCSEPSFNMVVHHDGMVYPCCSPAVFETILKIGSIREFTLDELRKKLYNNLLIYIIKKEGPGWFLKNLNTKGITSYNKPYISTCHLCYELFKNTVVIDLLKNEINEYHKEML